MRMHLPIALSPGHAVRAIVSLTTTTGAPRSSAAVSFRPSTMRMRRMSKNSGVPAWMNGSWPVGPAEIVSHAHILRDLY